MAEDLHIVPTSDKKAQYQSIIPQIKALVEGEQDLIANLSNISAALFQQFKWWWVGFYIVKEDELILGPFQGPVACTRIAKNRGVCGAAWAQKQTLIVENVAEFPGHIACSSASQSEIVVPILKEGKVVAVLDVDSEQLSFYDETDKIYLEYLCKEVIAGLF